MFLTKKTTKFQQGSPNGLFGSYSTAPNGRHIMLARQVSKVAKPAHSCTQHKDQTWHDNRQGHYSLILFHLITGRTMVLEIHLNIRSAFGCYYCKKYMREVFTWDYFHLYIKKIYICKLMMQKILVCHSSKRMLNDLQ